ncbi:hypothetical protein OEZ86_006492 [Tetradesmus obliquus]|nr:hypothetical protein OEZ86_006492 [Tetradesmus obliquus]
MGQLRCSSNCKLPKRSAAISSCSSTQQASYRLRPPLATDVPKLAAIEQLCGEFSANWSTADIQDELGKAISRVLVAADSSDEALGYIVGWLIAGELQVLELAVDPAHQSKGIGSALLAGLMQQCRCDADGVEVVLEVKAHNNRAIGLYRRHGFADVGLRRKYYADGSDALLMTRHAGAAAVSWPAPGADASTAAS